MQYKFDVEIRELTEEISEAKGRLSKQIEKTLNSESELANLEAEVQKTKTTLDFLTASNAPAELLSDQKARVEKAEAELGERKNRGGLISDAEAILGEMMIEEIELRIKLRQDKIAEIKAVV